MKIGRGPTVALSAAGAILSLAAAAPAQAPGLAALAPVERGQWQLTGQGTTHGSRTLCVADPAALLQLRHSGTQCSRFVIENGAAVATVHYTCPGAGHGRTTVRVETPRLVRLDTQGVADGTPFALSYEGRRTGECAVAARRVR